MLAADDIVKIDLGAHIDGFIVLAAHTVIVGQDAATAEAVATGRRAAVINATYTAAEVAAKLIKNGTSFLRVILLQFGSLFIYRSRNSCKRFRCCSNFLFPLMYRQLQLCRDRCHQAGGRHVRCAPHQRHLDAPDEAVRH